MPSVAAQAVERIVEVRIHGNHTTPDADVLAIAGLVAGGGASETELAGARERLDASGRFSGVDVLRRFASIADPTQILVIVVVDELPGAAPDVVGTPGPMRRMRAASMWSPVLGYADGYGFTYGARMAFIDPLGPRSRISVPLTWGGERRAGVEFERRFTRGPLTTVRVDGSLTRRVNPHYQVSDRRLELRARGERALTSWLRAGGGGRTARVDDGDERDRHTAIGADIAIDTRIDPSFPRNAAYAAFGIERLSARALPRAAMVARTDLRGYVGVGGSMVVALRAEAQTANRALPRLEQPLLGGGRTLRGYRAGFRAGDNMAVASAELRLPLNSPLNTGRFGLQAFVDAGTTWNAGERLRGRRFDRGAGGGIYFGGGPIIGDLAIAWPEHGKPRVHFGLGVTF
ncbi:MAG: BamA/TamA family outer membrane protein [Vicinamibacterales bacterium]